MSNLRTECKSPVGQDVATSAKNAFLFFIYAFSLQFPTPQEDWSVIQGCVRSLRELVKKKKKSEKEQSENQVEAFV